MNVSASDSPRESVAGVPPYGSAAFRLVTGISIAISLLALLGAATELVSIAVLSFMQRKLLSEPAVGKRLLERDRISEPEAIQPLHRLEAASVQG
jgi:hypothetical protein